MIEGRETDEKRSKDQERGTHGGVNMNHHTASSRNQHRRKQPFFLILCIAGLLVNYLLAHLATSLKLPLYLDNIGSALAAALGGYIPGIIVVFSPI